jgi:fructokinase
MTHLTALQQMATPFAFVRTEPSGDPIFELHGAGIEAGVASLSGSERELLEGAVALVVGSNTLTTKPAATVTCKTVEEADRAGVPVLFDPNLRPGRWGRIETALERCRALAASATVIKANLEEARLLGATDSSDPTALAAGLLGLGPRLAVVTAGAAGAVARLAGEDAAYRCPPAAAVEQPWPLGAGDAFMGALAAGLHQRDWDLGRIAEVLPLAAAAGAEACRHPGAIA